MSVGENQEGDGSNMLDDCLYDIVGVSSSCQWERLKSPYYMVRAASSYQWVGFKWLVDLSYQVAISMI